MTKTMKLTVLEDNIIVKQIKENISDSGLEIPETNENSRKGEILKVGPGRTLDDGSIANLDLEEGQEIFYNRHACNEIEFEGEKLLVMKSSNVIAIIG